LLTRLIQFKKIKISKKINELDARDDEKNDGWKESRGMKKQDRGWMEPRAALFHNLVVE
jgi:hypothetical protein